VPRLCELYHGICLTTEEKARKNLSQGSQREPVGMMKKEDSLPQDFKTYIDNPRIFKKKAVKKFSYTNCFYSLNEYFDNIKNKF
jgi:hypothetical protein